MRLVVRSLVSQNETTRLYRYNLPRGARSSMDRIRVSEALDTGSIPVGRATTKEKTD
mgnify:CR=1 FL=1